MDARFLIQPEPLALDELRVACRHPRAGAFAGFEGWVRNLNEGEAVQRLEYEAYQAMAEKEGNVIIQEATQRWDLIALVAEHRVGMLEIGDCAVFVGVASMHRAAAFEACRYLIDEIKDRVPIWKKEHYISGATGWINCHKVLDDSKPVPGEA